MRILRTWLGLAVVAFVAAPSGAQVIGQGEEKRFEIELRRWRPNLTSEVQIGGASVDPVEDLGLGNQRDNEVRGFLRLGRWFKIRGSGVSFNYGASKALERDLSFAGATFPSGATVETGLEIENIKGGMEVAILAFREGYLGVVADFSRVEARPVLTSAEQEADPGVLRVQLLTLGLAGRVYLTPALALTAEASGMKRSTSGVITDFEGVVTYNLGRNFGISFGYRNLYTKWLGGSDRARFRLEGYFFSGTARF